MMTTHSEPATPLIEAVRQLTTAMASATLYSPEHPQVQHLCRTVQSLLAEAIGVQPELSLLILEEELVVQGRPLAESLQTKRFAQIMRGRGIGHLKVLRGVSAAELQALITDLARGGEVRSQPHLRVGRTEVRYSTPEKGQATEESGALTLRDIAAEEIARFSEIYQTAKKGGRLQARGISEIVTGFIQAFTLEADPLLALAPLRAMDEYTFTHSTNVCILNMTQAMALGIEGGQLHDIGVAAMLHDVGKLFVPEEVLQKPGRLDEKDWEYIHQHPLKGAQYLLDTPGIPRLAVIAAFEHHIRYDGSGYPAVPAGWQQNLCSQMTTLSDLYDAMRTKRSYQEPMPMAAVATRMRELAGTHLHPVLCRNFLKILQGLGGAPAEATA